MSSIDTRQFEIRKQDHIALALDPKNQTGSALDQVELRHDALPELNFDEVSLKTHCLGVELATPFFVSGMTAGHEQGVELNLKLAAACEKRGNLADLVLVDAETRSRRPLPGPLLERASAHACELPAHGAPRGLTAHEPGPEPTLEQVKDLGMPPGFLGPVRAELCDAFGFMTATGHMACVSDV